MRRARRTTTVLAGLASLALAGAAPTHESIEGVEVVWEMPPAELPLRGAVFLAHGCSHSATDFWPASARCAGCLGLPEELRIVRALLAHGYAAVAASSADREWSRCWRTSDDAPRVTRALVALFSRAGATGALARAPLFLLGASSGGHFVGRLAATLSPPPASNLAVASGGASALVPPTTGLRVSGVCVQVRCEESKHHRRERGEVVPTPPLRR